MLFLIPLALTLLSTGFGIYSQTQQNQQLEQEGQQALADQAAQDAAHLFDQDAQYVRTVDVIRSEQAILQQQALADQAKTRQHITVALYTTAALLALLTVAALVNRK